MNVCYFGHSGFAIIKGDIVIIIDFFEDFQGVLQNVLSHASIVYFLCSHSHQDHFNPEIFMPLNDRDVTYILSKDIYQKVKLRTLNESFNIVYMKKNEVYEDKNIKINTFGSTDLGVSFLISFNEKYIFHAGDLNNWNWENESTEREIKMANGEFLAILKDIKAASNSLFLAMFPVDPRMGGDFAKGARQFVNSIKVDNFIPMHMWGMVDKGCDFELYRNPTFGNYFCLLPGQEIEI